MLELVEQTRIACYQLIFMREAIEVTLEEIEALEQLSEVVLRAYEVKKTVTQQDVLNVQIEQSKLENELVELRQREKSYRARLARLLHADQSSELLIVDSLAGETRLPDVESLAIQSRPDLQSQWAVIKLSLIHI